jgi:hypothetical protein
LLDRDDGEVGFIQSIRLYDNLARFSNKFQSNGQRITKIVAMHHHIISVPDTGYTNVIGTLRVLPRRSQAHRLAFCRTYTYQHDF